MFYKNGGVELSGGCQRRRHFLGRRRRRIYGPWAWRVEAICGAVAWGAWSEVNATAVGSRSACSSFLEMANCPKSIRLVRVPRYLRWLLQNKISNVYHLGTVVLSNILMLFELFQVSKLDLFFFMAFNSSSHILPFNTLIYRITVKLSFSRCLSWKSQRHVGLCWWYDVIITTPLARPTSLGNIWIIVLKGIRWEVDSEATENRES